MTRGKRDWGAMRLGSVQGVWEFRGSFECGRRYVEKIEHNVNKMNKIAQYNRFLRGAQLTNRREVRARPRQSC